MRPKYAHIPEEGGTKVVPLTTPPIRIPREGVGVVTFDHILKGVKKRDGEGAILPFDRDNPPEGF